MVFEPTLWSFIVKSGMVVKIVMIILITISLNSWTIIFHRFFFLKDVVRTIKQFEKKIWNCKDLNTIYDNIEPNKNGLRGIDYIFYVGFSEYLFLSKHNNPVSAGVVCGVERAMKIAFAREIVSIEKHLSFLATVGSISPYIGLFGTVWGIINSFQTISTVQQATISMVAPGISEALIATAMGLFAAIPAVIAYNRYSTEVEKIASKYDMILEEILRILHRKNILENKC